MNTWYHAGCDVTSSGKSSLLSMFWMWLSDFFSWWLEVGSGCGVHLMMVGTAMKRRKMNPKRKKRERESFRWVVKILCHTGRLVIVP